MPVSGREPVVWDPSEHFVERHVREGRGDRVALTVEGEACTYADLGGRVRAAAAGLGRLGLAPGDRVLLALLDSAEFVAAFLGAMRIGAVPLTTNPLLAGPDLAMVAVDSECEVAVVAGERADVLEGLTAGAPRMRDVVLTGDAVDGGQAPVRLHAWADALAGDAAPRHDAITESPGFWLSTGGTTGRAKLVMHRAIDLRHIADGYGREVVEIRPADRCFGVAPMFHAYGLGNSMVFPLSVGASAILEPRRPPTVARVTQLLREHLPTLFYTVPTFYAALLAAELPRETFASVRRAFSAGEALPAELFNRFRERFGVEVLDGVGSTELMHIFLSNRPGRAVAGTSGTPVGGYRVRLLDDADAEVAPGEPGQLWVRGESSAVGYYGRPDATESTFVDGWTRTGDLYARADDGVFTFLGRADEMFKIAGEWVSPVEVESVLMEHPSVLEAGVVGRDRSDGILECVAHVVEAPGETLVEDDVLAFCRGRLAGYKRPRRVVVLDALPKTAVGKIRRVALGTGAADAQARRPEPVARGLRRAPLDGGELEYEVVGAGAPVLLVHGSHVAGTFLPLLSEPELNQRHALIRYHRRGYVGSSPPAGTLSIVQQAADARALLDHLGIDVAHVVGHSYGGAIALQFAHDAPERVGSLALLEPALLSTPAGATVSALVAAAGERFANGDWEAAEDLFLGSPAERTVLEAAIPGSLEQAVRDMDTYFRYEVPAHEQWAFGPREATVVAGPALYVGADDSPPLYDEIRATLSTWIPAIETVRVPETTHLLHVQRPAEVAAILRRFFERNPLEHWADAAPIRDGAPAAMRPVRRRALYNAAVDLLDANLEGGGADRTAIRTMAGDVTYAAVAESANRFGNALLELGVRMEERVVIAVPDSPEFAAAFFGAIKMGAIPVPVATDLTAGEYAALVDDSRAAVVVAGRQVALALGADATHVRHLIVTDEAMEGELGFHALCAAVDADLAPAETTSEDVGFLLYGVDATGRPKGVVHLQRSMRACADAYAGPVLGLSASDVTFSSAKLHLAYGLGNGLYLPFAAGATSVLVPGPALPRAIAEAIRRMRPTVYFGTPGDFPTLASGAVRGGHADDFASLRLCVSSGGPLPGSVLKRFTDATGVELLDGMGSIESGHIFISSRIGDVRPGSTGTLVDGYEARLVDEHGRDVATGRPGRLLVRGESVFAGYWRRRRLSADTLLGDWLRTEEMFSRDDSGRFFYEGRADHMLAIDGLLVSPREIEDVIRQDGRVRDCAIVGVPAANRLVRPEALLVVDGDAASDELVDALRQLVRRRLGSRKTPRAFRIVASLPRDANGELRRDAARRLAERVAGVQCSSIRRRTSESASAPLDG